MGRDSLGHPCIVHKCASDAVVCRWMSAACRGRFGREDFVLDRTRCRSLALLDAVAAVLALQVFVRASEGQTLVAQARGPFWRWSPLPSQDCTLESALDQNNLHAHCRGHVVIYIRDTYMPMHHSLDNTIIANAVQHISSIAWAPDPGGTQIPATALKAATLMTIQGATTILQCMEVRRALDGPGGWWE